MKIHLGCGNRHISGFTNIDIQKNDAVDLVADITNLPYDENTVDLIYACSVLEHFGRNSNLRFFRNTCWTKALRHWYSILKPGGEIYLSVPDFESICLEYMENKNINSILGLVLGGQKNEEDLHGMLFDFQSISTCMLEIGFSNIVKYDWKKFEPFTNSFYDDLSAAYLPHKDFKNGRHMMLNIRGIK